MITRDSSNPINRVKCAVDTCKHHSSGEMCMAESIKVQMRGANDYPDADCATFIPKS